MAAMESDSVTMSVLDLPSEVLLRILSSLSTYDKLDVRLTCRRLYSIGSDPFLWTSIVWHYCGRNKSRLLCALKVARPCLKKILLYDFGTRFPLALFTRRLAACDSLQSVALAIDVNTSVQGERLKAFISSLKPKSSLSLFLSDGPTCRSSVPFRYESCEDFAKFQSLEISGIQSSTRWAQSGLLPACMTVHTKYPFEVRALCVQLQDFSDKTKCHHKAKVFITLACNNYKTMFSKVPKVEVCIDPNCGETTVLPVVRLAPLSDIWLALSTESYDDEVFSNAINHPNRNFVSSTHVGVKLYEDFSLFSAGISFLYFKDCLSLDSKCLVMLANECPNVVQLQLEGCTNCLRDLEGLAAIGCHCPRLRELSLACIHCWQVSSIKTLWEILITFPQLTVLALSTCVVTSEVPVDLEGLSEKMCQLTRFELLTDGCFQKCDCIADFNIQLLTMLKGVKFLKLMLQYIKVNEYNIISSLPKLKVLDLSGRCIPPPPTIQNLEQLYVESGGSISDDFLDALASNSNLVCVTLSARHVDISAEALLKVVKQCPRLVNLGIYGGLRRKLITGKPLAVLRSLGIGYKKRDQFPLLC